MITVPIQPMRLFHVLQHAVYYVSYRLEGIRSLFGNKLSISAKDNHKSHFVRTSVRPQNDGGDFSCAEKAFPEWKI